MRYTIVAVRPPLLRNIRTQTGLIFFAGVLSLVVVTFAISVVVGNAIRQDDARLAMLDSHVAASPSAGTPDDEVAIRQRRDGNVGMIRGMFGALFLSSLVFLLIGLWFVQQIIVAPIEALDQIARRVASGDLDTPTQLGGSSEFQDLAQSFETMRLELRAAAARQAEWAAQLEERVAQRTEELATLHQEMRQQAERVAALQERERIGMELHDGLLQTLGYLYLKTDQAEAAAAACGSLELAHELSLHREVLEQASQEVRRFIADLRELPPPPTSLSDALTHMIAEMRTAPGSGALPTVAFDSSGSLVLPADWVAHLTRIAREALINAVQHGRATEARITCRYDRDCSELCIEDNGAGFDVADVVTHGPADDGRPHFGLSVMRARASRIGGALEIQSMPGKGTRVCIRWPLAKDETQELL